MNCEVCGKEAKVGRGGVAGPPMLCGACYQRRRRNSPEPEERGPKLDARIDLYITQEERSSLVARCTERGQTISQFVRKLITRSLR